MRKIINLVIGRDAKRLNWLESTRSEIDTDGPGFVIYGGSEQLGNGLSGGSFKTLRGAIDAAMGKRNESMNKLSTEEITRRSAETCKACGQSLVVEIPEELCSNPNHLRPPIALYRISLAKCPQCGSTDISTRHIATGNGLPECYCDHCNNCGHDWNQT